MQIPVLDLINKRVLQLLFHPIVEVAVTRVGVVFMTALHPGLGLNTNSSALKQHLIWGFFVFLFQAVKKDLLIFVIDEAQFIDSASWEYLENLLSKVPIFMIMALSPFHYRARQPCPSAVNIIKSPQTTYVQLRELKPSVILQKACQDLGVVSIPRELET